MACPAHPRERANYTLSAAPTNPMVFPHMGFFRDGAFWRFRTSARPIGRIRYTRLAPRGVLRRLKQKALPHGCH